MQPGAFSYNGIHSSEFKIISKSINRPILPALRPTLMEIPGRHGSYDFGISTYADRQMEIFIVYIGSSNDELRTRSRDIARWLSSMEYRKLIFDDEPDKFYMAKIFSEVGLQNLNRLGQASITFICQPFAYSVQEYQDIEIIETAAFDLNIEIGGTFETPNIIDLINEGGETIEGFELTLEYLNN